MENSNGMRGGWSVGTVGLVGVGLGVVNPFFGGTLITYGTVRLIMETNNYFNKP